MRACAALGGVVLAACTLTVDTDGLTGGPADAAMNPDGGPTNDAAPLCAGPTDRDPKNCGACGHDCFGGACVGGRCGPSVIARGFNGPLGVGVTGTKVYVGHDR